jgi:hypothetical protein
MEVNEGVGIPPNEAILRSKRPQITEILAFVLASTEIGESQAVFKFIK